MKVKDFLKSTSFKCIVVLCSIALVAGGILSVLNDLLAVSDEEKLNRVIQNLYGNASVTATVSNDYTAAPVEISEHKGYVNKAYELSDGNMIVNATGADGYKGGTVTVWLVATVQDGAFAGVRSVALDSYTAQTLMSQFDTTYYDNYTKHNEELADGTYFSTGTDGIESVSSGATKSSNAINNAVNSAVAFVKEYLNGKEGTV